MKIACFSLFTAFFLGALSAAPEPGYFDGALSITVVTEKARGELAAAAAAKKLTVERSPQFITECLVTLACYAHAEEFCGRVLCFGSTTASECEATMKERMGSLNRKGWFIEFTHPDANDNTILVFFSNQGEFFILSQTI